MLAPTHNPNFTEQSLQAPSAHYSLYRTNERIMADEHATPFCPDGSHPPLGGYTT